MSNTDRLHQQPATTPETAVQPETEPRSVIATVWGRLLSAAEKRFPAPEFEVTCDDRHTIWIKRTDGTRSIGISQWLLRRFTLEQILARAEARLAGRTPKF